MMNQYFNELPEVCGTQLTSTCKAFMLVYIKGNILEKYYRRDPENVIEEWGN